MDNMLGVTWNDVRSELMLYNPQLVDIIDRISPDDTYRIYKANYHYLDILGDEKAFYYPEPSNIGQLTTLESLPKRIINDLSYANGSIPLAVPLSKNFELFLQRPSFTCPYYIYKPGDFFGVPRELLSSRGAPYFPAGLLRLSSGIHSSFVLPSIGHATNFATIQKEYGIHTVAPQTYYSHPTLFKDLCNSKDCTWRSSILYFSQKWRDSIKNDHAWIDLKSYLLNDAAQRFTFEQSRPFYELMIDEIESTHLTPVSNTAILTTRQLIDIALGQCVGFMPCIDETELPLTYIQNVFNNSYRIKQVPIIMHATTLEKNVGKPIYYSTEYPTCPSLCVKSDSKRRFKSDLINELYSFMETVTKTLTQNDSPCANTITHSVLKHTDFGFYHFKNTQGNHVELSSNLFLDDPRFTPKRFADKDSPSSAKFFRGCVKITPGQTDE